MRRPLLALVCCLCLAALPALENPPLPAATTWLVNIDVRQALSGPSGDLVRQIIESSTAKPQVKRWFTITGIDPLHDVDRVLASGTDFTPATSTMMLTGRFDAGRLLSLVESAQGHQAISHGSTVIHRWIDPFAGNREVFAALVDGNLLFAPTRASAIGSIDALAAKTPATGAVAATNRFTGPLIAVIGADDLTRLPRLDQSAAMLRQITQFSASLQTEGDSLVSTVVATATDEATASQLQQIGQGLLALAALNKDTPPEAKALLAGVQLSRTGKEITVTTSVPLATIRAAMAQGGGR